MTLKIRRNILSQGAPNVPGRKMKPKYITVHNTANTSRGANAEMHARYDHNGIGGRQASWHYTVDDTEIWQTLEDTQQGWHAGDGSGAGNTQSIGIEICENSDGNFDKAVKNAQRLIRKLMNKHGMSINNVVPHKHWSGKNCPRKLLGNWDEFKAGLVEEEKVISAKSDDLFKVQIGAFSKKTNADNLARRAKARGFDQYIVKEGGLYKVQIGAFSQKANADEAVKKAKKAGFDVYIIGGKSVNKAKAKSSKPSPKPKPKSAPIKVGDKVTMSNSAKRYATGEIIPTRYKGKRYTVQQISGDRALLKELFSWVNVKDIGGPKKPAKPALKAGSRVTLKTSAKTYATGEAIPARIKGKRYTIQQVSKGRVLLKEIFSWVRNSDVI